MPSIGDQLLLKRGDLLTFPKETVDLILEMQKNGWRGHKDRQGHVKMLAPDGETHVMATSNRNSPTYLRQGLNQYLKRGGKQEVNVSSPKTAQKWPCARPNCPKVYAKEEQLNRHIMVDHEKQLPCEYEGCNEYRATKQKLTIHMTHAHGYVSPRKAQRKKQEAARKAKEEMDEAVEIANMDVPVKRINMADSPKFDHGLLERQITSVDPEVVRTDVMKVEDLVSNGHQSLKEMGTKFINDGVVVVPGTHEETHDLPDEKMRLDREDVITGVLEGKLPNVYSKPLMPGQDKHYTGGPSMAIGREEELEFIDERDSWVINDPEMMASSANSIKKILAAVGLEMEIRVWRKK